MNKKTKRKNVHEEPRVTEVEQESLHMLHAIETMEGELTDYYPKLLEDDVDEQTVTKTAASYKRAAANLSRAHSKMYRLSDEFYARWKDIQKKKKGRLPLSVPVNTEVDLYESRDGYFAKGINVYKLLLICFAGSLVGVLLELFWCLINNGYLESRSGLVWGPFNLLYGVGAVVLSLVLYHFRNRGAWLSFLGGALVGSVVEYACSWGQEMMFGSRSWDYSHLPFNIQGRICLLYSVFWGILGVFWIKKIYPLMSKWILKIPNKAGKIVTWVLTVFFVLNSVVTLVATDRWVERLHDREADNVIDRVMDARFPNERMERIFANMEFGATSEKDS